MNKLQEINNTKKTENGDISYKSTGNNLTDIFFLTSYFEKNLDQVKLGETDKEKLFAMFVRDPRFGLGRRDLGRKLMELAKVAPEDIALAGRYDDLWHIPTDENIAKLFEEAKENQLAKKWLPRLTGKDKKYAKALCKEWEMSEKEYRAFIKTDSTTEYKLSYAEAKEGTPLNELFKEGLYTHPLVDEIEFEKVPSLAMKKYLKTFSTREDLKDRFNEYMQKVKENKAKVNVATATVHDAFKTVNCASRSVAENADILAKKVVENETIGVEMDAIVILDTSGSMGWYRNYGNSLLGKAMSIAHGIATHSTYAKNQVISFSSRPQLMTIKGRTLKEQYDSMFTGDCSNTDFRKVMQLLQKLEKFPKYLIVISDMEFDAGSNQSKEETMRLFKQYEADTKIIWWNLNDRNKTVPEYDSYGNIYLSGYNMQILKLLENDFDMTEYLDKILKKYKETLDKIKNI